MKKSDLYREWARVLDMCEGTNVNPFFCWKYDGENRWFNPIHNGEFYGDPEKHEFMVCILNGNPLFLGDKVFWKNDYHVFNWDFGRFSDVSDYEKYLLWNPPKKTFMLNGDELPCPVKDGEWLLAEVIGFKHSFNSPKDAIKVGIAIDKLLTDNTK